MISPFLTSPLNAFSLQAAICHLHLRGSSFGMVTGKRNHLFLLFLDCSHLWLSHTVIGKHKGKWVKVLHYRNAQHKERSHSHQPVLRSYKKTTPLAIHHQFSHRNKYFLKLGKLLSFHRGLVFTWYPCVRISDNTWLLVNVSIHLLLHFCLNA